MNKQFQNLHSGFVIDCTLDIVKFNQICKNKIVLLVKDHQQLNCGLNQN